MNPEVFGWKAAIRGMRNPMNSWDKSDSFEDQGDFIIGPNDMKLMWQLIRSGAEHRKFLRMIHAQMDITAPLYWWKEFDTYKVGTVANSCSTMHKIHSKVFVLDDFSHEHLTGKSLEVLQSTIDRLNFCREVYLKDKDKDLWWQMIQLLPSSYNQKRTIDMSYEVCRIIIHQRTGHKLDEWNQFVDALKNLDYMGDLWQ
jgi:hypothetical protein